MYQFFARLVRRRTFGREIEPDEIFLDAHNLPALNTHQFEGRFERPIGRRPFVVFSTVSLLVGCVFGIRAWVLMVEKGEAYAEQSENNRIHEAVIFAERGVIYDRKGTELAWNAERKGEAFAERRYKDAAGLAHILGYVGYPSKDARGFFYREDFVGRAGV